MLILTDVDFSYSAEKKVLQNVNLTLQKGEFLSVMGPSGCGKSTLLNLISGLLTPTHGSLSNSFEKLSYVFQEPRLFPWLTVEQNLAAVLPRRQDPSVIQAALETVGLPQEAKRYPAELSGGMKSRVSLARALVYGGDLLLLDEPFSALDRELRQALLHQLRGILSTTGTAAVFVTHQAEDAAAFSNRLLTLPLIG